MTMQRREFIALSALVSTMVWPSGAHAQQKSAIPRIGYLSFLSAIEHKIRNDAFREGLRKLGYIEGRNVLVEYRFADGNIGLMPALAAQLVESNVDLIVTYGAGLTYARGATSTIPIVMAT